MPPKLELPKNLADLLEAAPKVTTEQIQRMKDAAGEADRDPKERAELQKALFVNSILNAMKGENLTQSEVARRMDCSRQYLSKLLDEDASVNFTIETLSSIATAANRRAVVSVLADDEEVNVVKRSSACTSYSTLWEKIFSAEATNAVTSVPSNIIQFKGSSKDYDSQKSESIPIEQLAS